MKTNSKSTSFHSGFVTLLGRSNVGKSTMLNALCRQKVAIVSPKPQTTRNRIVGIKNITGAQIVFLDTPGVHQARSKLGQFMNREALSAANGVDLVLFVTEAFDGRRGIHPGDLKIAEILRTAASKIFLIINKIDLVARPSLLPMIAAMKELGDFEQIIPISARTGEGLEEMVKAVAHVLPEGPKYYPDELVTDQPERFLVGEVIREKVILLTQQELPYASAVVVESFTEDPSRNAITIEAMIQVERKSQKTIVIGKGGAMIKDIGIRSRKHLSRILGATVHLSLFVRVEQKWRQKTRTLSDLGYVDKRES